MMQIIFLILSIITLGAALAAVLLVALVGSIIIAWEIS